MDIWSVLILVSIAHSLFVIVMIGGKGARLNGSRNWLLGILLVLVWFQFEFLSIRWPFNLPLYLIYGTRYGAWLILGPLVYAYIRSIAGKQLARAEWWHFIPFVLAMVLPLFLSGEDLSFRQVHYGMLTPFDRRPDEITVFQFFYSGVFIFQYMHLAWYIYQSYKVLGSYHAQLEHEISSMQYSYRWLNVLLIGIICIMLVSIVFIVLLFFTELYRRHFDYLYVLPTTLFVYMLSYKLYDINWDKPTLPSKYSKSGLKPEQRHRIRKAVVEAVKDQELYLNKELRLNDLAAVTDLKPHHISEVLNSDMKLTFFDLVNQCRVDEAKRLMAVHPNYTLLHIAYTSGFNNKTSFVNAFKKFEQQTPSSYLRSINA